MSDEGTPELSARIDALVAEVRRQGRAAVAAQAAAEECLEAVHALRAELGELRADRQELRDPGGRGREPGAHADDDSDDLGTGQVNGMGGEADAGGGAGKDGARTLALATDEIVRALLPVADAIDRVVSELEREPAEASRWWERILRPVAEPRRLSLQTGAKLLRASLEQAFERMGVRVDRRVGVPVEGEVHRVVGVRDVGPGVRPGTVATVARPGYSREGRILREADVIAVEPEGRAT